MDIRQESPAQLSSTIRLCSLALCFDLWITSLLTPNLVTTFVCYPSFSWCLLLCNQICATWKFLWVVCSVMVPRLAIYGAATKPRASYGLQPQGCAARHALVSRFLVMIHCKTTPMCYFHVSSSLIISPYLVKRSVRWIKCNWTPFWSRPMVNLWRTGHWHELNRLQEMVEK